MTEGDGAFLLELYAAARKSELDQVEWPAGARESFLQQQFEAQSRQYANVYSNPSFQVVERAGSPIGRLYVHRGAEDIRIVDIALIPEARGQGIGSALIGELVDEGRRAGSSVSIHVEKFNPAMRLYERLGFVPVEDRGVYLLMAWTPPAR